MGKVEIANEQLTEFVALRMSASTRADIQSVAQQNNKSQSEVIRSAIIKGLKIQNK